MPRHTYGAGGRTSRVSDLAGAPPQLATSQDLIGANEPVVGNGHPASRSAKQPNRINLKAVAEACIEEGLDPATEIIKALNRSVPLVRNGAPVMDDDGKPVMVPLVDSDTRLRTLNELLQYTQPKLKAVEVKLNGNLELSSEQLDQRLGALIAKAAKAS